MPINLLTAGMSLGSAFGMFITGDYGLAALELLMAFVLLSLTSYTSNTQ